MEGDIVRITPVKETDQKVDVVQAVVAGGTGARLFVQDARVLLAVPLLNGDVVATSHTTTFVVLDEVVFAVDGNDNVTVEDGTDDLLKKIVQQFALQLS